MIVFVAFSHFTDYFKNSAVGSAMNILGNVLTALGRHQDALLLEEQLLEHLRHVMPENDPTLGST